MAEETKERYDLVGAIMDYEDGQLDEAKTIELFQYIVDHDMLHSLQGHYGRAAEQLLKRGLIKPKRL